MPTHPVIRRIASALTYRDFRVLWMGAFTSSIGTWMQKVAQSWLVLTVTGSPFYLGLDAMLGELPLLLFTLIGGVVADRVDRRKILLASQYVQMATAFTLAALVYWNVVHVWHILALSFITGTAQAFGGPAYQSLLPALVSKNDMPNAIAMNSTQFNLARIIGPLLAGVTLVAFGSAACFALNGLSFLVVIASLLSLRIVHIPSTSTQSMARELHGGLTFVRHDQAILTLAFLAFCTTLLASPVLTLLPVIAKNVFHQDAAGYTVLMAFSGAGSVVGALTVAWMGRFPHMGRLVLTVQVALGFLLVAFASSRLLPLSYALLFFGSLALLIVFSMLMSLVQLTAPNAMRGRVMSIFMVGMRGGNSLGSVMSGTLANATSAPTALIATGLTLSAVAALVAWRGKAVWKL
ncbi:MAG: MFS transporter [Acidobacteria bacterium]|nr:MFS transporter [Acidobacteriota bacterium]